MAKTKVILYASNHFKYRIEGSVSWTPLVGNTEHVIEFNAGDRVEISSIKSVSELKIRGAIKNVEIFSSDLTSLDGAFEGTRELDFANVNSSVNILSMNKTFKDSGVLTFDIQTTTVLDFDDAFYGTNRIENINIDTLSATSMNRTFKDSNAKSISNILPYNGDKISEALVNSEKISSIDAINLSTASEETLEKGVFKKSDKLITGMDLMFFRGKISVRKKYYFIQDNKISDGHIFEMDLDGAINETSEREEVLLVQDVDDSFDFGGKEFEIDIETISNEMSERSIDEIIQNTDDSFDPSTNKIEIDIEPRNLMDNSERDIFALIQDTDDSHSYFTYESEIDIESRNLLDMSNRDTVQIVDEQADDSFNSLNEFEMDIDSLATDYIRNKTNLLAESLDNSSDLSTYELEIDIEPIEEKYKRNSINVNTLDESFDSSKFLEIDLTSGWYDEDPLGDNSLVFMTDTFSENDMISDTPISFSGMLSSVKLGTLGQRTATMNINCQSVDLSNSMISNFSFEYDVGTVNYISYRNNTNIKLYMTIDSNGNIDITINGLKVVDLSNVDTSGSFNFCRDGDNYYVYINNVLISSGTRAFTPFVSNNVISVFNGGNGRIWNIRAFNRYITQADVLALNGN